jgi:stearoyl-CoA desaturase (Delta-9 desaturase)
VQKIAFIEISLYFRLVLQITERQLSWFENRTLTSLFRRFIMNWFIDFLSHGFLDAAWWQVVIFTLIVTHITMISVTVFLHRHQAHGALMLHPIASHFFRFWLWLTTGIITKEWVGIHRKHHAKCDTVEDPHSPQTRGIRTVLLSGSELYRAEAKNSETLRRYGNNTPSDWLEKNLYSTHSAKGILLMFIIDCVLFGPIGITIWAIQMAWTPIMAAGIINGVGHFLGYRNFDAPDYSTNISPWGILIAGEELHNNHHTYPTSAKLSVKWYEFDIGWMYIRLLSMIGLATVKRVPPQLKLGSFNSVVTVETVKALAVHRYEIMANFAKQMQRTYAHQMSHVGQTPEYLKFIAMRDELYAIWSRKANAEELAQDFKAWCTRAEQSQIQFLSNLSRTLRSIRT